MNEQEILTQEQVIHEAPIMPQMPIAPAVVDKKSSAIAGFVLGIVSLFASFIPLFGLPCSIVGIVMGSKGMKSSKKTLATIGLVLSIIGIIATIAWMIIGGIAGYKLAQDMFSTVL